MASEESIPQLKMLIIGPSGSGKSALLIRYCDDQFDSESSTATIGVDFKIKKLLVHGRPYRLNLLDTAGQERFRTLSNSYYRGAQGIILCYDISSRESFSAMERWYEEAEMNAMDGAVTYLVGCKVDVVEDVNSRSGGAGGSGGGGRSKRAVQYEEGRKLAEERGSVGFCEVSSKKGVNVKKPFVEVVDAVVMKPALMGEALRRAAGGGGGGVKFGLEGRGAEGGCAC